MAYVCVKELPDTSYSTGVPDPPTGLSATQVGPSSIRVSWTAPVSGATVTGYRISYSGGTDQGSVDVGASATDRTITINPPQSPVNYSISIVTLSCSFPSSMAGPIMVIVGKQNALCFHSVRKSYIGISFPSQTEPPHTIPAVTPETATDSMTSECVYCIVKCCAFP